MNDSNNKIQIRKSADRGHTNIGWLNSKHTFSFGDYYDPEWMGYRSLRVINDDIVAPGMGFGTHGHQNMEIISIVLEGSLEHKDSLGQGEVLHPGEVQVMSAGKGIQHSEFNSSKELPVHFLQIWVMPEVKNLSPAYYQKSFPRVERINRLCRIAGRDNIDKDGAIKIHQDADIYLLALEGNATTTFKTRSGRGIFVQVAEGEILVNDSKLAVGDGLLVENVSELLFSSASAGTDLLLFDLN